ncbi:MAG: hypothetical protein K0R17_291 [Rariglobus sp.]|jgi:tetratricopeptide (TPR) repeat protein|nr:hypothetical protein [Rariglobus sp.]
MISARPRIALFLVLFLPPTPFLHAADTPSLETALALFEAKRVPEAREQLVAIVAREPKNVRALRTLGLCELKMRHREAAADTFAKAVELDPRNHALLADYASASFQRATELGVSFRAIGFARRGRNALEQAVTLAPDIIGYREGLVQFYTRAPGFAGGSFDRAYAHIDEITKRDPARGAIIRANTLCADQRYEEALAGCEAFLRDHPDHYLALYTLGRIVSETDRDPVRGETALRRCLELTPRVEEPDHAAVHYRLGLIAEKDKRPADARRSYQAALALEPAFSEATEALTRLK